MKLFSKPEVLQTVLTDGLRDTIMKSSLAYGGAGRVNVGVSDTLNELRSVVRMVVFSAFLGEDFFSHELV